jgi:hypothetical protein
MRKNKIADPTTYEVIIQMMDEFGKTPTSEGMLDFALSTSFITMSEYINAKGYYLRMED